MEYFNTYKNYLFIIMTRIMNLAVEGKDFTEQEVEKIIRDTKIAEGSFVDDVLDRSDEAYEIMSYDFKPAISQEKIPINPTALEKRWLKSIIEDDFIKIFLDKNIILKLQNKLQDVEPLFIMNLRDENINYEFIKVIVSSFRHNKLIRYNFIDGDFKTEKIGMPFKLNYSLKEDKFRLSVYLIEEGYISRTSLENILSIEIIENLTEDLVEFQARVDKIGKVQFFKNQLQKQMKTLRLKIVSSEIKNTVDRAHFLFSAYDKKSIKVDDYYVLEVKYYNFEEDNIIRKVLSLGNYVTVLEPEDLKQKFIALILKSYNLQKRIDEE